jgi:ribosomal protein S18 acetylase RimI-like enzyme
MPISASQDVGSLVTIRIAAMDDATELLRFWSLSADSDGRLPSRSALFRMLTDGPSRVIIAAADTGIVGSVIVSWDGWRGRMQMLAVAPVKDRLGTAHRLVNLAETRLNGLGADRVEVVTGDRNDLALRLLRAREYRHQRDWSRWVKTMC